ncbi:hypothetical protein CCR75_008663 [Bremia lactucae]|uniref:Uncharacterized protein n=1 Tax=Bremia lactucae TaxID=4779 RepID=A0A976NY06_BRELC|nr:hypothetical protein CCR75_008663 [Bremia lactucae]
MDAELRISGFKRILVRLDESTRRKYCCRALEEDLQHAKRQMRACAAAMAEAKEVDEATRKLHASQRAAVSSEKLSEFECLQQELEAAMKALLPEQHVPNDLLDFENGKEVRTSEARTLAKQLLRTHELEVAVTQIKQLVKLMPLEQEMDDNEIKWWTNYAVKVVAHAYALKKRNAKVDKSLQRLDKQVKKFKAKMPALKELMDEQRQMVARKESDCDSTIKKTKKRATAAIDNGKSAKTMSVEKPKTSVPGDDNKSESVATRTLLHRCSREVRALRDKFELGVYDVNLSRIVNIVDSLWSDMGHSEMVSLSTALFTMVEIVDKIVIETTRRDRLMCLESVLGVIVNSSKLPLSARRKTMVEEYAMNCRQSIEQLNRQASRSDHGSSNQPRAQVPAKNDTFWAQSHVRFN